MNPETYDPATVRCPVFKTWYGRPKRCADANQHCPHYLYFQGRDPKTDQDISRWGCGLAWQPVFQVNLMMKIDGLHAAVNELRNEGAIRQDQLIAIGKAQLIAQRQAAEAGQHMAAAVRGPATPPLLENAREGG